MDKFDIGKVIASVNWPVWLDWTILIDLSGFALAIIGFLNLADPIERYFRKLRDAAELTEKQMNQTIRHIFPLRKNWWRLLRQGMRVLFIEIAPFVVLAIVITGSVDEVWHWIRSVHWGWLVLIIATAPIYSFALWVFSRLLGNRITKYIAWLIWRIVSVLSYPPSGVLGTIGLAITIASLTSKRLS